MLSDRLKEKQMTGFSCPVMQLEPNISKEDFDALIDALKGRLSIRQIHDALRDEDIRIGREALARHRNHRCSCGKPS